MSPYIINGSFYGQRTTGQQRYATEVSKILLRDDAWKVSSPGRYIAKSRVAAWGWTQGSALRRPGHTLLSMTSRAPVFHPKHVYVAHDIFPLTNPEWYSQQYLQTHRPLLRHHLKTARGIIAVSPMTLDAVQPYIRPGTPTTIAPNGLTPDIAAPMPFGEDQKILNMYGITPKCYLLAVGSNDPRKNFNRLTLAYAQLPIEDRLATPLLIVGGSSRAVFSETERMDTAGLQLLDYIEDRELNTLYRNARAFISPSLAEGFGIPVIEAAAHGTPLLLADIPVHRWLAEETAHYFDPNSTDEIAHALLSPPQRPTTLKSISNIHDRFSWDRTAAHIRHFVEGLSL